MHENEKNESLIKEERENSEEKTEETSIEEEFQFQLQEKQNEIDHLNDRILRLAADFDNFKKRSDREREQLHKFGNERILLDLLPILDSLDQANLAAAGDTSALAQGLKMVRNLFEEMLKRHHISSFSALMQPFDPSCHEAIAEQESATCAEGVVIAEMQKGYKLHERLVRAARVVVAKSPQSQTNEMNDESE